MIGSSKKLLMARAGVPSGPVGAWDLSYAVYTGMFFSVSTQETTPLGITFKDDGTKMYITGTAGDDVNEYNLSTAWDVSTASYLQNFSVAAQEISPTGVTFKTDGTKMYIVGSAGDDVNEYNLSTAWNVSSAVFLQNFSVAAQASNPSGLTFKPDGTKMYVTGFGSSDVEEYDLSTAWNISTATHLQGFSVAAQEATPGGVFFKPDGTQMYVVGVTSDRVQQYSLSTAWDISSAVYLKNFNAGALDGSPGDLFFKPDGTIMYVIGAINDRVYGYDLG